MACVESRHRLDSPCLGAPATLDMLVPAGDDPTHPRPLVLLLPVSEERDETFGVPARAARAAELPDLLQARLAIAHFDHTPWYADHASDPHRRHESHLLDHVLPFLRARLAVTEVELLGFSKSGWGAFTLLVRHPQVFARAAVWDVPWMLSPEAKGWGLAESFGSDEVHRAHFPALLAAEAPEVFRQQCRLALAGEDLFGPGIAGMPRQEPSHTVAFHRLLEEHGFAHTCHRDLHFAHHWESGWLGPLAGKLSELRESDENTPPD